MFILTLKFMNLDRNKLHFNLNSTLLTILIVIFNLEFYSHSFVKAFSFDDEFNDTTTEFYPPIIQNPRTPDSELTRTILYVVLAIIALLILIIGFCICRLLGNRRDVIILKANTLESEDNENSKRSISHGHDSVSHNKNEETNDEHSSSNRNRPNTGFNPSEQSIPVVVHHPSLSASEAAFLGPSEKSIKSFNREDTPPQLAQPTPVQNLPTTVAPQIRKKSIPLIVRQPETTSPIPVTKHHQLNKSPQTGVTSPKSPQNKTSPQKNTKSPQKSPNTQAQKQKKKETTKKKEREWNLMSNVFSW